MKKLAFAVIAALSILASPVLAGPGDDSQSNSYQRDFQLQGR
jgi:hypothetical protein